MDAVINENTGSWDVIFGSWVKIASDHQTPVSDLLAHEFGHQGDFEASVQEAGYENLDMQLNLTWDRMQRHGKRNGWSADETRRRALGAVKTQFETAYKNWTVQSSLLLTSGCVGRFERRQFGAEVDPAAHQVA